MGWIGSASQLYHFLRVAGCDQTGDKFNVDGSISSFMGMGEEFVVGDDAVYYVNGAPCPLAQGLAATSYGMQITVIDCNTPTDRKKE